MFAHIYECVQTPISDVNLPQRVSASTEHM